MKTFGLLVVTICLTIVLAGSTSYAAPACCDPAQAQGQNAIFPSAPTSDIRSGAALGPNGLGQAPRVGQPASRTPQIVYGPGPMVKRPVAPAPAQRNSVYPPAPPVAARPAGGCCAGANAAPDLTVRTSGRGRGGACASCLSSSAMGRDQVRPSIQPGVPGCCAGRGVSPTPVVQAPFNAGGYLSEKPLNAAVKPGPRTPATLTANSAPGRSSAPRFGALW